MAITGGCLCGEVRFVIEADAPLGVRQCWRRVCQYLGAGSSTVNAIFPKAAVTASGPLTDYVSRADSGSTMHRRFCARCGTPIFSEAKPRPHQIIVRAGRSTIRSWRSPPASSGPRRRRAGRASIQACPRPRNSRPRRRPGVENVTHAVHAWAPAA